ncbi:MAG TPA: YggU family protein [Gammaproteobacteria bacterium]|nr:YggU family protein [Gammaproteobacteria bacterium]
MPRAWYNWQGDVLVLNLRVQPGASRNEICEPVGEQLKIRLTSPPVDGKANQQLLAFLAKQCGVAKTRVKLLSGGSSRNKRVGIDGPVKLPAGVTLPQP